MKAMLLAAGLGKRLRPLTEDCPKCLLPIMQKPLLYYHLHHLLSIGVRDVVINIGWCGSQIYDYVNNNKEFSDLSVQYSQEASDALLETGGAIYKALPLLGDAPFIVINADVWTKYDCSNLLTHTLAASDMAHLVLVALDKYSEEPGDFVLHDDRVLLLENKSTHEPSMIFSGISLISPALFQTIEHSNREEPRFPLRLLFERYAKKQCLSGELFTDEWRDIGTLERLNRLRADYATTVSS